MTLSRSHATRVLHLLLLLTVLHQLIGSNFMERPFPGDDPAWPYALHEWVGLGGLSVISLFWLWTLIRDRSETSLTRLLPWFSAPARAAVVRDVANALRDILSRRAPGEGEGALASAVHGLGLLVVSLMALTGAAWFLVFAGGPYGRTAMGLHKFAANFMWAYLIGHASLAVLRQILGDGVFARMFWFRRRAAPTSVAAQ